MWSDPQETLEKRTGSAIALTTLALGASITSFAIIKRHQTLPSDLYQSPAAVSEAIEPMDEERLLKEAYWLHGAEFLYRTAASRVYGPNAWYDSFDTP